VKDQQQTLSVRISDALRRRLESARRLVTTADGPVSISEVAKRFLEAAHDDNIEASELLSRPTETLLNIRHKWERQQSLSRPEWLALGYYLQVGCEEVSEDPELPTAESYASLLEAFVAARSVRAGKAPEADHYYLGNLGSEVVVSGSNVAESADSDAVAKVARSIVRRLRESSSSEPKPVFVGRNLYVLFRDERLKGIEPLNKALRPYIPALFRIAARGHYLREGRPVREHLGRDFGNLRPPQPPPVVVGNLRLSITLDERNEFSMLLDLGPHRVLYPLDSYPVIREFAALLGALKPSEQWTGREFFGYADRTGGSFQFRRRSNGITITFSSDEFRALGELVNKALELPELQPALEDALLAYGEI
jgi:hypothetical protein